MFLEKRIERHYLLLLLSPFFLLSSIAKGNAQTSDTTEVLKKLTDLYATFQKQNTEVKNQIEVLNYNKLRNEEDLKDATEKKLSRNERRVIQTKLANTNFQIDSLDNAFEATSGMIDEVTNLFSAKYDKQKRFVERYEKKFGVISLPPDAQYESVLQPAQKPVEIEPKRNKLQQLETNSINAEIVVATGGNLEKKATDVSEKKNSDFTSDNKPKKPRAEKAATKKVEPVKIVYANYNQAEDVMLSPPNLPCKIAFNGIDNFTGKNKKETAPEILLTYTEDLMRPQLKDKEFITCSVTASRVQGGFYFLTLKFEIATKEAQRSFGFLDRGIPFSFKLLNGRNINLPNIKTDVGVVDALKGTTTYSAIFQLYSSDVKNLTSAELDQIRVAWSAGIDDYEIYDVNALRHIFACLEN